MKQGLKDLKKFHPRIHLALPDSRSVQTSETRGLSAQKSEKQKGGSYYLGAWSMNFFLFIKCDAEEGNKNLTLSYLVNPYVYKQNDSARLTGMHGL